MTDIAITDVTNSTHTTDGTGIFDVLIQTVERHIEDQYQKGRLSGTDYANVYLGAMQTVLQQAIQFTLTEQQASNEAALIAEKIDTESANTAKIYESITSSESDTIRKNILNSKEVLKTVNQIALIDSQNLEVLAGTLRSDTTSLLNDSLIVEKTESENKNNEINGLIDKQKDKLVEDITSSTSTSTRNDSLSVSKINTDVESITASTARTVRDDSMNTKKELLVAAQTLGFASDTKQKVLKQMFENYAVNLSIAGVGNFPEAGQDAAIDHLVNDILSEVGVTSIINTDAVADLKTDIIPPTND